MRRYAGPGHWNDPDMLEVGNGLTVNQDRAHFTLWCMMASPLILGNDIRNMNAETKAILTNADLIAINQDMLGVQGLRQVFGDGLEYWFKPLENGDWAMTIFNPTRKSIVCLLNWQNFNFTDLEVSGCSTNFNQTTYKVKNLWSGRMEGKTSMKNKVERRLIVPAQDVITYRLMKK